MEHSADNKRIARNTLYLYARSLLIMAVSLYTSRVVLQALGDVDYGVYNLVATVVVMFNVFSATFTSTTQRFLNVEHGRGDKERARKVFSASLNIFLLLSAVFVVVAETGGLWFLNNSLNIPAGSMYAANVVYQLTVVTFVINLISIPYNAVIIANERMGVFAVVSVYEAVMKLVVAFMVMLTPFDRLITYAVLIMLIAVSVRMFYGHYCLRHFDECHYGRVGDRQLYRDIFAISGWNFLGSGASLLTLGGIGIIVNMFTNILANTAKGIASQIENAVTQLVTNFMTSLRPQLTKSYAAGDYDYMLQLVDRGTRFSFFLTCAICFPIIFEADNLLRLWLGEVPMYATGFVQLVLIYLIQNAFSTILDMVLMATGRVRDQQITLSILQLLNLPLSCLLLWAGLPPYSVYFSFIAISYVSLVARAWFVSRYTDMTMSWYWRRVFLPMAGTGIVAAILTAVVWIACHRVGFWNMLAMVAVTEVIFCATFWTAGINRDERRYVIGLIKNKINR